MSCASGVCSIPNPVGAVAAAPPPGPLTDPAASGTIVSPAQTTLADERWKAAIAAERKDAMWKGALWGAAAGAVVVFVLTRWKVVR